MTGPDEGLDEGTQCGNFKNYHFKILTVTTNVDNKNINRNQISICVNAGLYVLNCITEITITIKGT